MTCIYLVQIALTLTAWYEMTFCYKITQTGQTTDFNLEPPPPSDLEPMDDAIMTKRWGPPVRLPDNSLLLADGTIRFPNSTILETQYAYGAIPLIVRTPNGVVTFFNRTMMPTGAQQHIPPPPGIPLNATTNEKYPSLILPSGTVVFRDGGISLPGHRRIHTVFKTGFIPSCDGIECHHRRIQS